MHPTNSLCRFLPALLLFSSTAFAQPHGELIGWNVARFYQSEETALRPRTSPFFFQQPQRMDAIPDDFAFEPTWVREDDRTTITIDIPENATLYGLGRAAGTLVRANARFESPAASPWILGLRDNGSAFGIVLDTTWASAFDIQQTRIAVETPDPDPSLIIMDLPTPGEVTLTLAGMTGRMEIPPLWALGVQTSAAANAPSFPWIEAAWLSCEITDPDPAQGCLDTPTADRLADAAQKRIAYGRFTISREDAGRLEEQVRPPTWIQDESGDPLSIDGRLIPDFTNPETHVWWGRQIAALADQGAAGIVTATDPLLAGVPATAWLTGNPEISGPGPVAQYAGIFSLIAAQATWELFDAEERDQRVLIAIPTAALSAQRWTVHLINANSPQAPTPRHLIGAALNSSLTAQPIVGASLPDPASMNASQWQAWVATAALLPLIHLQETPSQEADIEQKSKVQNPESRMDADLLPAAAALRMHLLPYLYTLVFNNFFQGDLVLQPLFMHDPADAALRNVDTAFLLGRDLLVIPPLGDDTFRHEEHFSDWRRLEIGDPDPRLPALYLRPGAIIPLAPPGERTADWSLNPLTIVVALGDDGQANGTLYEDEWDNFGLLRGQTRRLAYNAQLQDDTILVRLFGMDGGWGIPQRTLRVRILTDSGDLTAEGSERGTIRIPVKPEPSPE